MALPPAQPAYILRGHGSQIHVTIFIRDNTRLVSGDSQGWVAIWDLATKRPTAVWRAHKASILGASGWGSDRLITHGKDNKILVWKIREKDEASLSSTLPIDLPEEARKQPWLLYALDVNTMNFCPFAQTDMLEGVNPTDLLIAVPNTLISEKVDIYHLPSSTRYHSIPSSPLFKGGMVMSLVLFYHPTTTLLTLITAFESGHTSINHLASDWIMVYLNKPHSQPILSLAIAPDKSYFLSSSADAIIAKHTIPCSESNNPETVTVDITMGTPPMKILNTKHAGQQDLKIRNDGKIFATAGWDGRARVYGCKALRELAVLKWHKEGCYAVAFAEIDPSSGCNEKLRYDKNNISNSSVGCTEYNAVKQIQTSNQMTKIDLTLNITEERAWKAQNTHWIAVGSKDGKISLWNIF